MPMPELHDLDLTSPHGNALRLATEQRHGAALANVATRLDRMFLLRSPWAPGLRFVGALAQPPALPAGAPDTRISFAGGGETVEEAFVSCIGEAVERLSQFERDGDANSHRLADITYDLPASVVQLIARHWQIDGVQPSGNIDWMPARSSISGTTSLVPADWVLRRQDEGCLKDRAAALSTGAAAGASFASAAVRALLELVERDAAALWWLGGRRARPVSAESGALAEAGRLAPVLRHESRDRASWLLDITSDLAIPTIAAVSVDADGRGFVCGLAARLSLGDAVRSALIELCQLEIGLLLARAKCERAGETALTDIDRRHLQRAAVIDAETCSLIHPTGFPRSHRVSEPSSPSDETRLARLTEVLLAADLDALLVDLTRPDFAIPVVKAIAPQMQQLPSEVRTKRLLDAIATTGGGDHWTRGVPLT